MKGLTKDICYQLVGYLTDTKSKMEEGVSSNHYKSGLSSFGSSAHNAYKKRVKEGYVKELQYGKSQGMVKSGTRAFIQS